MTLKHLALKLAGTLPMAWPHTLCGRPVLLPFYHIVSDTALPHSCHSFHSKSRAQFLADLDTLLRIFSPISLSDFLACARHVRTVPSRSFLLSFDDGLSNNAEIVAPILKAKGVPAVFFVNSAFLDNADLSIYARISLLLEHLKNSPSIAAPAGLLDARGMPMRTLADVERCVRTTRYAEIPWLDRIAKVLGMDFAAYLENQQPYLSSSQIRAMMRDGFAIGAHGIDHTHYGVLTLEQQLEQTRISMQALQQRFGVTERAFAFPLSDAGVSPAFFEEIARQNLVDVTFGTGGIGQSGHFHYQRFSMDNTSASAPSIVNYQCLRHWALMTFGR